MSLFRSAGGWAVVQALRRGRETFLGDERILGSSAFVETLRRTVADQDTAPRPGIALDTLVTRFCAHVGLLPAALAAGGRTARASRARERIAYLWITVLGHPGRPLALPLGIRPQNVYRAAAQGQAAAAAWERVLSTTCLTWQRRCPVPRFLDGGEDELEGLLVGLEIRREPAFVPDRGVISLLLQNALSEGIPPGSRRSPARSWAS